MTVARWRLFFPLTSRCWARHAVQIWLSGQDLPDPYARYLPAGVHGPAMVVDSKYAWKHPAAPRPPAGQEIIYEVHVGTFTDEGTFAAARGRLDYLADLGVTAIELMPLSSFAGSRGWGYDGVAHFAPLPDTARLTTCAASSTTHTGAVSACYSTWSTITSVRPVTTCASSRNRTSPARSITRGARPSISRRGDAALRARQRALLVHRVPNRWPASRRHPNHCRPLAAPHPGRVGRPSLELCAASCPHRRRRRR